MLKKICSKCGVEKDVGEFYVEPKYKDGRKNWCRECSREYWHLRYQEKRDDLLEYQRNYHQRHRKYRSLQQRERYWKRKAKQLKETMIEVKGELEEARRELEEMRMRVEV